VRIASVEVVPYALPFRAPYVTARGTLGRREMALLRLRDEDGLVGLGEAVPLSLRGGATLTQVVEELERLGELDELDEATLTGGAAHLSAPARCAALTALMDLRGRRADAGSPRPTADAPSTREHAPAAPSDEAGGEPSAAIPCNATLVSGPPASVAADAERWAAEGFATFKLKLGAGEDVAQVRAVREAVGPAARIRVDANAAWDLETARQTLAALEPLDVELAEQPVATLEESAELAQATSIPIAGDESIEGRADAERALALGACRLASLKLSKVGGPEAAIEVAEVVPSYLSSALDGPVGIAAAAQVAQTLAGAARAAGAAGNTGDAGGGNTGDAGGGNTGDAGGAAAAGDAGAAESAGAVLAHGLATQRLFAATVAAVACELRDGMLHPPPGPGLGVEIDEAALAKRRL
jgi:L-alanine-DL-glutamate epimerase-like enolase superfamily enzyme